ncbi:MAG: helix-turn-helix domain-containing protein [Lachnospiraceae bacterium]|nr:helix-turn-helix domain-containing protein [Lachnospiraceae bacterium]
MNQYVTGAIIKELREMKHWTQSELAEKLNVSDKTISKWETAKGYPDITLLEPIARVFGISLTELLSGNAITNMNVSANMLRSKFYVCPICGNVIHSMGEMAVSCHGVQLMPEQTEESDENHMILIERIEDEYFVQIPHSMTKEHYISFIAALSSDGAQIVKLYPEGSPEARLKIRGVKRIYCFCNRDGLFHVDVNKYINGKNRQYEDAEERCELEKIESMLFT